jgi:uncharacterized oxidoreductase
LNDKFLEEIDPTTLMEANKLITIAIKGLENDSFEIYPGAAKAIKIISRLAPNFLLNQLSKSVDKMLLNGTK